MEEKTKGVAAAASKMGNKVVNIEEKNKVVAAAAPKMETKVLDT